MLSGGRGDDRLDGEDGNDALTGGSGVDQLFGGDGNDVLKGDNDADVLHGDAGDDNLSGGRGNDQLYGDGGNDTLKGESGADELRGGAGTNRLIPDRYDTVVEASPPALLGPVPLADGDQPPAEGEAPTASLLAAGDADDVNGDGHVTPLDVLLLINALNANAGSGSDSADWPAQYNVNQDGRLTPADRCT